MTPTFTLPSPETKTDYTLFVAVPDEAGASQVPVPAVLFMDGDDQFPSAVAAYLRLRTARQIPPLLLVGVGYGASYASPANRRGRVYTATNRRAAAPTRS